MTMAWVPDEDCETHEWRSAAGETIRFVTRTEAQQRFMPPVTLRTIAVPQTQGARFRGARHDERLVTLPVVFPGPQDGRDEIRRWARALDPVKGEGTLTVVQGDHAGRQLVCAYEAGLDDFSEEFPMLGLGTLAFHAADPYWQDATEHSEYAGVDSTVRRWFPFPPLILGSTDVFAELTVTNDGDVDAWPVITALGLGSDLTVSNDTTGQSWTFTGYFGTGSVVVVDHRPGHKSVTLDGANAFGRLSDDSVLWPLVPGPNRISIAFASSTGSVQFTWRNRWLSA